MSVLPFIHYDTISIVSEAAVIKQEKISAFVYNVFINYF